MSYPVYDSSIPNDYLNAIEYDMPGISTLVEQNKSSGESWMDSLAKLLPNLVNTYQQKQLLEVQIDRARAGLPPLDTQQYSTGINVGLSPDTQKMIMFAALGLGALFVLSRMMK